MCADVIISFRPGVDRLQKILGEDTLADMELVAEALLKKSIDSPIPSDTRALANSATSNVVKSRNTVIFGFNRVYAAFQDAPGRTTPWVIKPRRKLWLFVPLTQAGRKHRLGANPKNEGLVFGGFFKRVGGKKGRRNGNIPADYILAKQVIVPIKPYGSPIGPNHYFSETLKRNGDWALERLSKMISRRLKNKRKP